MNTMHMTGLFCREVVLDFVASKSEMIGGDGKVVEIDETSSGKGSIIM
jgi:hypothetical protein